jgi:hypothetical protein
MGAISTVGPVRDVLATVHEILFGPDLHTGEGGVEEVAEDLLSPSFGVAIWPTDGREPDNLLAAGRPGTLRREAGRDRVMAVTNLPTGPIDPAP